MLGRHGFNVSILLYNNKTRFYRFITHKFSHASSYLRRRGYISCLISNRQSLQQWTSQDRYSIGSFNRKWVCSFFHIPVLKLITLLFHLFSSRKEKKIKCSSQDRFSTCNQCFSKQPWGGTILHCYSALCKTFTIAASRALHASNTSVPMIITQ